jgi:hypothetical protein
MEFPSQPDSQTMTLGEQRKDVENVFPSRMPAFDELP